MNGQTIGAVSVVFGLVAFGAAYNAAVTWARKAGWMEPYTALWVAVGVAVTIVGIAALDVLLDLNAGLLALICFAASGAPMVLGDGARYVKATQSHITHMRGSDDQK